ncbi:glycosyltransferase family 4 protein [Thalassobellus suaedae]|uniref:Glycosyltransferase n=1 Tax=Thalassobellus suaedae TaxID=3074124 RepID=A0ABY9XSF4_9FLAO|nr:glycosyltransferase [Flavobacteriaceae bacterium HL-DH14]
MKVLWFTNTSSLYENKHSYHGGGWIDSLEKLISKERNIELAVGFFHPEDNDKKEINGVTYYPILKKRGAKKPLTTIFNNWRGNLNQEIFLQQIIDVVNDYNPDVIHVFGTENIFGRIQEFINIPVIIHLQGLINPYLNAYFPVKTSLSNLFIKNFNLVNYILGKTVFSDYKKFKNRANQEKLILKKVKYVMGRTDWDKSISKLFNPSVRYFHINEVLRDGFYNNNKTNYFIKTRLIITTTISSTVYKGVDVLLKAAKLLKEETNIDFIWQVIGVEQDDQILKYFEKTSGINHESVGLTFLGVKTPNDLIGLLENTDIFVHPSYIDNSPNSVCEAQMLGVPVIACNVGGMSTIIKHHLTGILVPSNGVYEIVSEIINFYNNQDKLKTIGMNSNKEALIRHNKNEILTNILDSYGDVINDQIIK